MGGLVGPMLASTRVAWVSPRFLILLSYLQQQWMIAGARRMKIDNDIGTMRQSQLLAQVTFCVCERGLGCSATTQSDCEPFGTLLLTTLVWKVDE